ncbi:hypothetical protein [Mycobacterium sp. UM_Kg1]|uniref:hypothetical protein n=1 Tax=Mycobacterium sp. UM_Kg1 TaxID=1545691 RepID=UPI000B0970B9|nr:hypothetical protein [Mycobacterium sp. UM_Kg1]
MSDLPAGVQAYIDRLVSEAPKLSTSQRDRLFELLKPVRIDGAMPAEHTNDRTVAI